MTTKADTITRIIRNAYGKKYDLDAYEIVPQPLSEFSIRHYLSYLLPLLYFLRNRWIYITSIISVFFIAIGTIYYYNEILVCQHNVEAGESKVAALMQRRNDISVNLSKAVLDYSKYERDVFTGIVALRTLVSGDDKKIQALKKLVGDPQLEASVKIEQSTGKQVGLNINSNLASGENVLNSLGTTLNPLGKLMAVAEQYPDLKLSATFTSLMTALIDVEKDIAAERLKYNDLVNKYAGMTQLFPGNLFASMFNFPEKSYFTPTEQAKTLVPIGY